MEFQWVGKTFAILFVLCETFLKFLLPVAKFYRPYCDKSVVQIYFEVIISENKMREISRNESVKFWTRVEQRNMVFDRRKTGLIFHLTRYLDLKDFRKIKNTPQYID